MLYKEEFNIAISGESWRVKFVLKFFLQIAKLFNVNIYIPIHLESLLPLRHYNCTCAIGKSAWQDKTADEIIGDIKSIKTKIERS